MSIRWYGHELLAQPYLPNGYFQPPSAEWGEYEQQPVFGYDDCWPTLDPSLWPGRDCEARDHGELHYHRWKVSSGGSSLMAEANDDLGEWRFVRRVYRLGEDLRFDFSCSNLGTKPLVMNWIGHALFPASSVTGVRLPKFTSIRQEFAIGIDDISKRLKNSEDAGSLLLSMEKGKSVMLVLEGFDTYSAEVDLGNLRLNMRIWGIERPALGIWLNRSGYPQSAELVRDELGIEWMISPWCRLADAAGKSSAYTLLPRVELQWGMIWRAEVIR